MLMSATFPINNSLNTYIQNRNPQVSTIYLFNKIAKIVYQF